MGMCWGDRRERSQVTGQQRIHRRLPNRRVFKADSLEVTKGAVRWGM